MYTSRREKEVNARICPCGKAIESRTHPSIVEEYELVRRMFESSTNSDVVVSAPSVVSKNTDQFVRYNHITFRRRFNHMT